MKKSKKGAVYQSVSLFLAILFVLIILTTGLIIFIKRNTWQTGAMSSADTPATQLSVIDPKKDITQPPVTPQPTMVSYAPQSSGYQLTVPILMYHYVGNNPNPADKQRDSLSISPEYFEEQLKYLSENGYSTISLDTLYAALKKQITLPNKAVILTFDDGYIDFYVNAYPILRRYNLHATVFIPINLMSQGFYLSWPQIKEMSSSGLIIFGSHGVHHQTLTSLSDQSLDYELSESKKVLQTNLGIPINFIAYPYGITDNRVIQATQKAGYVGAVGTWPSKMQSEGTIYNMPRFRITNATSLSSFISFL